MLEKGILIEYGREYSKVIDSYLIAAPVNAGNSVCVMVVRVWISIGQNGKYYLHGIDLLENIKETSRTDRYNRGSGLGTGKPDGGNPRDVFRVARKLFAIKHNYAQEIRENIEKY